MNTKAFRTGLAAVVGATVLLAGILTGVAIARADDSEDPGTNPEMGAIRDLADRVKTHARELRDHVGEIADELGIELDELRERVRDGATLEELAEEAGVDIDAILENIRESVSDRVDERVDDGSLSEEQGDRIKERIESFDLDDLPDPGDFGDMRDHSHRVMPFPGRDWLGDLDLELDIDLGELRDKLESGMSLDEALDDVGVDLEAAIEGARDAALERIDELVDEGVLSEERAAELKETIESFDLENGVPFGRNFHFDFDGFGGDWLDGRDFHGHGGQHFEHRNGGDDSGATGEGVLLDV